MQPGSTCERTGKGANYEINSLEFIHGQLFSYLDSTGQWRWVATQQKGKRTEIPHYFLISRQFLLIYSCAFSSGKKSRDGCTQAISGLFYNYQYSPLSSITRSMRSGGYFFQVWGVLALINMRVTHSKWRYLFKKPHGGTWNKIPWHFTAFTEN